MSRKRILQVIATAYRGTLEEQDDTVVWLTHALKGANAGVDVCLRGNAVNYAVSGQDASGLAFGAKRQTQPPRLAEQIATLIEKGVIVYVVPEDAAERGIAREALLGGLRPAARGELPALFAAYDQVWHW
jgi:hypothetical protein